MHTPLYSLRLPCFVVWLLVFMFPSLPVRNTMQSACRNRHAGVGVYAAISHWFLKSCDATFRLVACYQPKGVDHWSKLSPTVVKECPFSHVFGQAPLA